MSTARRAVVRVGGLVLGLAVALATSGCVAAGLASGPLMSAVQLVGDRTVERTVGAELAEAQGATEAVLARMAFRIESRERDEGIRRLRAVADHVTVHARLERVTAKLTRVGLRVETGGLVADRDTGAQMHDQIAAVLAPAASGSPVPDPAAAEALTTLQAEIRKLRSDIEDRREATRPVSAGETGRNMRVEPDAVVVAPMSAALPTVGGPAPPVSVALPAAATAVAPVAQPAAARRETAPATADLRTAAPLHPAGTLTPILPVAGLGSGN
jgi:hypothetical protein